MIRFLSLRRSFFLPLFFLTPNAERSAAFAAGFFCLDITINSGYKKCNEIGQFETILSVNKTRERDGRVALIFCIMRKNIRFLTHSALLAALYVALTHLQNLLIPGSATWAIQFRASEALCILAFFTPAAIPGMTIGCLLFNITYAGALPLDFLIGSLASFLAAGSMWLTRKWTPCRCPVLGLCMPALFNAILVGWELTVYIGGGFWLNALYVAIGELAVLWTLGWLLYGIVKRRNLDARLFG